MWGSSVGTMKQSTCEAARARRNAANLSAAAAGDVVVEAVVAVDDAMCRAEVEEEVDADDEAPARVRSSKAFKPAGRAARTAQ